MKQTILPFVSQYLLDMSHHLKNAYEFRSVDMEIPSILPKYYDSFIINNYTLYNHDTHYSGFLFELHTGMGRHDMCNNRH